MADQEMQDAPGMMSLNDALALMRATAAEGKSSLVGPALLARLVKHVDCLQRMHDVIRERLDALERQEPVAWMRADFSGSASPTLQLDPPGPPSIRDELRAPLWTALYASPVPAIPAGWRPAPVEPT